MKLIVILTFLVCAYNSSPIPTSPAIFNSEEWVRLCIFVFLRTFVLHCLMSQVTIEKSISNIDSGKMPHPASESWQNPDTSIFIGIPVYR